VVTEEETPGVEVPSVGMMSVKFWRTTAGRLERFTESDYNYVASRQDATSSDLLAGKINELQKGRDSLIGAVTESVHT
jgi:hypothetical protein